MRRFALVATSIVLVACSTDGREMRPPTDAQNETVYVPSDTDAADGVSVDTATLPVESVAASNIAMTAPWVDGGVIPAEHTCAGADLVPGLSWSGTPEGTVSIAIVVIESSQPTSSGVGFVHLAATNIDPATTSFPTGALPTEAILAANDFSTATDESVGWRGPCPTAGTTATYSVEVHALDQMIELPTGTPGADMVRAIDFATIASASVVGTVTG